MTVLAEDLDLSWVTFTDGTDDDPCEGWKGEDCGQEAVAVAHWVPTCHHQKDRTRYCVAHRDLVLASDRDPTREFVCEVCGAAILLARMEPIW